MRRLAGQSAPVTGSAPKAAHCSWRSPEPRPSTTRGTSDDLSASVSKLESPWRIRAHTLGTAPATYPVDRLYVYCWCMPRVRTNIELEDSYVRAIMERFGVHTKTEAVDLALRHLAGQPMSRAEALAMRGVHAIGDIPADVPAP